MQTVNIQQLKANSGTDVAAAREDDMVVVMNHDRPQGLRDDLERLGVTELPVVDKAAAEEAREEMRCARDWLVKPAE